MNTSSILAQELKPLNQQIEQVRGEIEAYEEKLRLAEQELDSYSTDTQRFDALRDVCNALDKLSELESAELFWDGVSENLVGAEHVKRLRGRIVQFDEKVQHIREKRDSLRTQINQRHEEIEDLHHAVRDAYAREERRLEEFIIEREISEVPRRSLIMPWTNDSESEGLFRRAVLIALLASILFGVLMPMVSVPVPDRSEPIEIPERLAKLVKKEPPKPEPLPEKPKKEEKPKPEEEKPKKAEEQKRLAKQQKPATAEAKAARKKAESTGVLAFKSSFADLMDEMPVARVGAEARLSKSSPRAAGQATASRSLVAMAKGSSGGIGSSAVSRNIGTGGKGNGDRIGGVGFARVASSLAGMQEQEARPVSDAPGPSRTDEEIQIVFDRYKALLYRIYNKELRKDPTLRGKLLLRLTIDPSGAVSLCKVESTDLASPHLVSMIVERVKKFNFGTKKDVPKTTILYPIDFLPAG